MKKPPTITRFLWDAIDRCDPTRSHEAKPSQRDRDARHLRRLLRACAICGFAVAALLILITTQP